MGALKSIRHREDKFTLLGYLYQAYMDWGKYRYFMVESCKHRRGDSLLPFALSVFETKPIRRIPVTGFHDLL